jgi:hypothetical protein
LSFPLFPSSLRYLNGGPPSPFPTEAEQNKKQIQYLHERFRGRDFFEYNRNPPSIAVR